MRDTFANQIQDNYKAKWGQNQVIRELYAKIKGYIKKYNTIPSTVHKQCQKAALFGLEPGSRVYFSSGSSRMYCWYCSCTFDEVVVLRLPIIA